MKLLDNFIFSFLVENGMKLITTNILMIKEGGGSFHGHLFG